MSAISSLKGSKLCLLDFTSEAKKEAEQKLTDQGFEFTPVPTVANIIVVLDKPSQNTENRAKRGNIPIMSLAEILELGKLDVVQDLKIEESKEITYIDAIEIADDYVRILDIQIPRRKTSTSKAGKPKDPSKYSFLCLDKNF